jgi:hypothetical protein
MTPENQSRATLDGGDFSINFIQQWNQVCSGFTSSVLGTCNEALSLLDNRYGLLLNRSGDCKSILSQAEYQFLFEVEFPEGFVLG